jgi:hypothetical protein
MSMRLRFNTKQYRDQTPETVSTETFVFLAGGRSPQTEKPPLRAALSATENLR